MVVVPVARVDRVLVRPMLAVRHVRRVGVVGIEPSVAEITAVQVVRTHDPRADVESADARVGRNEIPDRPDVEAAAMESRLDEDPPGAEVTTMAVAPAHDHVPANRHATPRAPGAAAAPRAPVAPPTPTLPAFDSPVPCFWVPPLALIGLGGKGSPQQKCDAEGAHEGCPYSVSPASGHESHSFPACGELPQHVRKEEKQPACPQGGSRKPL